jgi:hypothetical protein
MKISINNQNIYNRIGGVIVSLLATSAVDRGFEPGRVKPKTMKLVFVTSPLSTQH